mmetsp:Transcript_23774/g.67663  ORF Transcript_23774/g.67663 Transcript_23774/m.67663 type:complete len:230 (-) Transcript_23774:1808-2497(-)
MRAPGSSQAPDQERPLATGVTCVTPPSAKATRTSAPSAPPSSNEEPSAAKAAVVAMTPDLTSPVGNQAPAPDSENVATTRSPSNATAALSPPSATRATETAPPAGSLRPSRAAHLQRPPLGGAAPAHSSTTPVDVAMRRPSGSNVAETIAPCVATPSNAKCSSMAPLAASTTTPRPCFETATKAGAEARPQARCRGSKKAGQDTATSSMATAAGAWATPSVPVWERPCK